MMSAITDTACTPLARSSQEIAKLGSERASEAYDDEFGQNGCGLRRMEQRESNACFTKGVSATFVVGDETVLLDEANRWM